VAARASSSSRRERARQANEDTRDLACPSVLMSNPRVIFEEADTWALLVRLIRTFGSLDAHGKNASAAPVTTSCSNDVNT
jgi:hypothetical protein